MCESFGMQLDDDSLLALYHVYDPEGTGYLAYMDLVKHLMHPGKEAHLCVLCREHWELFMLLAQ